jgi:hypothetical protein
VSRIPESTETIKKKSWDDMQALFAAIYFDEIAAIEDRCGKALVREKIAGLSAAQRSILRPGARTGALREAHCFVVQQSMAT